MYRSNFGDDDDLSDAQSVENEVLAYVVQMENAMEFGQHTSIYQFYVHVGFINEFGSEPVIDVDAVTYSIVSPDESEYYAAWHGLDPHRRFMKDANNKDANNPKKKYYIDYGMEIHMDPLKWDCCAESGN